MEPGETDVSMLVADWQGLGDTLSKDGFWYPARIESSSVLFILKILERLAGEAPETVVAETGVLYGTLYRRLVDCVGVEGIVWAFSPSHDLRNALYGDSYFVDNLTACIKDEPIIDSVYCSAVDLLVINSDEPDCWAELAIWQARGKDRSVMVIPSPTEKTRRMIFHLNIDGAVLDNESRSFVSQKGGLADWVPDLWSGNIEHPFQEV